VPACRAALPTRIMPQGSAMSSQITITSEGSHSYAYQFANRQALKFIIVCGLASTTSCPAIFPRPT